jgi:hypothetical protein
MWQRNYFTIDNLLNNDKRCHNLKPESNQRDYPQCVPNVELFNHVLATAAKAVNTIDNPYHLPQPCNTSASDMSMFPFWLFFPQYLSMQRSLNMWSPPRSPDSSGESAAGNLKIKSKEIFAIFGNKNKFYLELSSNLVALSKKVKCILNLITVFALIFF